MYQLFCEGATIGLSYLDDVVPSLTLFCCTLEREFSFPFQTNAYLTLARAKGFKAHYDTHDVFVLQVVGSNQWTLYGSRWSCRSRRRTLIPRFMNVANPRSNSNYKPEILRTSSGSRS